MTPRVRYQYERFRIRFVAFRDGAAGDFTAHAWGFLASLPATQRRMARCALRQAFPAATNWDEIRASRPKRNTARLRASILIQPERVILKETLGRSVRDRAFVWTLYAVRRFETAAIRWNGLDLSSGLVYVYNGKGGRSRSTVLHPEALAALREWYEASGRPSPNMLVFPGKLSHRQVSPAQAGRWLDTILRRAGLKRPWRGAHAFRRTMATEYLRENRADLAGLQELLGHEDIKTTLDYVFIDPGELGPRLARVPL